MLNLHKKNAYSAQNGDGNGCSFSFSDLVFWVLKVRTGCLSQPALSRFSCTSAGEIATGSEAAQSNRCIIGWP